jgi:hypothetical protein
MNLVTHKQPHGDELCAFALLKHFGSAETRSAKIVTVGSTGEAIPYDRDGDIVVGIGGGRFDEHNKNEQECAATLIAQRCHVDELKFFRLLEEVRACDLTAKSRSQQLPEILKCLYDHKPEAVVIEWGLKAYSILVGAVDTGTIDAPKTDVVEEASVEVLAKYHTHDQNVVRQAWHRCQAVVNNHRGALTELSTVAWLIARDEGADSAKDWVSMGIEALFLAQLDYQNALQTIHKDGYRFSVRSGTGQMLKAVAIYGENRAFSRAFRSSQNHHDILIVRNGKGGHVQVFSDTKTVSSMRPCFSAICYAEAKKRGKNASLDDFRVTDTADQWYLHKSNMVLNGSKSHSGVEVTRLTDDEILDAVRHSFNQELTLRWLSIQEERYAHLDSGLRQPLMEEKSA